MSASWYDRSIAPTIVDILIKLRVKPPPGDELIRNISGREFPNHRINDAGIRYIRNLYYEKYATPTTVTAVNMSDAQPVMAIPLRDNEILDPIGRYEPGNPDKKLGYFKKMFGISSKPIAKLVAGTRRRSRRSKKKKTNKTKRTSSRKSSKKSRRRR